MEVVNMTATIIQIAATLTAIGVIIGAIFKLKTFIDEQKKHREEMKTLKAEQRLQIKALFACLDGLEQLGANHSVPKAKAALEEWLNDQAHE